MQPISSFGPVGEQIPTVRGEDACKAWFGEEEVSYFFLIRPGLCDVPFEQALHTRHARVHVSQPGWLCPIPLCHPCLGNWTQRLHFCVARTSRPCSWCYQQKHSAKDTPPPNKDRASIPFAFELSWQKHYFRDISALNFTWTTEFPISFVCIDIILMCGILPCIPLSWFLETKGLLWKRSFLEISIK